MLCLGCAVSFVPLALLVVPMALWGPETPRWLLSKSREEEALLVLQRLRGPDHDAEAELLESGSFEEVRVLLLRFMLVAQLLTRLRHRLVWRAWFRTRRSRGSIRGAISPRRRARARARAWLVPI